MMEGNGKASEEHVQLKKPWELSMYKEIYPYLFLDS